eukprot:1625427-Prymnesium_polylepis.1
MPLTRCSKRPSASRVASSCRRIDPRLWLHGGSDSGGRKTLKVGVGVIGSHRPSLARTRRRRRPEAKATATHSRASSNKASDAVATTSTAVPAGEVRRDVGGGHEGGDCGGLSGHNGGDCSGLSGPSGALGATCHRS